MEGDLDIKIPRQHEFGFNPRPRMEGDTSKVPQLICGCLFQSTPPHGGRLAPAIMLFITACFNPRPRMEGDLSSIIPNTHFPCFNPRPRMEGDFRFLRKLFRKACFNPRPRMEGDNMIMDADDAAMVSIHAPAWRATWRPQ